MKKITNLTILFFICISVLAQNRAVDVNDPIADIDLSYTEADGVTRLTVVLNTVEKQDATEGDYSADVTIKGLIQWKNEQQNSLKYILKETQLRKIGSDKPFVLFTDLYDGTNSFLKKPSGTDQWEKLSLRLSYLIDGKSGQTPRLNLYPPIEDQKPIQRALSISTSAIQKGINKGIISIKTTPSGTPFEVTELKVVKKTGADESSTTIPKLELGNNRFSYNGELLLPFNTSFNIETLNSKYFVTCKAVLLGNPSVPISGDLTEVVFVPDPDLVVLNRPSGYSITLSNGRDDYIDGGIETRGNGNLGVRFLNAQYSNIRSTVSSLGNGKYNIKLEGLSSISSETSSTYYYTNGSKDISAPLVISKKLPKVSNFKFNGVKGDSLLMSFKLAGIDDGVSPTISLSGDLGAVDVGGNIIVQPQDDDIFNIYIDRNISGIIAENKIVNDATINVKYGGHVLYGITVTIFNQKLYEKTIAELEVETNKKPKNRNKDTIKLLVEQLLAIGEAIGNSIEDDEVNSAIDELQNSKADKVKSVMSDIGKWALIAGKIVLPILV